MKGGLRAAGVVNQLRKAAHTVCALMRPPICLSSGSENLLRVSIVDSFQEVRSRRYIKPRSARPGRKTQQPASQVFGALKAAVRAPPTEHIKERQPGEQEAEEFIRQGKSHQFFYSTNYLLGNSFFRGSEIRTTSLCYTSGEQPEFSSWFSLVPQHTVTTSAQKRK